MLEIEREGEHVRVTVGVVTAVEEALRLMCRRFQRVAREVLTGKFSTDWDPRHPKPWDPHATGLPQSSYTFLCRIVSLYQNPLGNVGMLRSAVERGNVYGLSGTGWRFCMGGVMIRVAPDAFPGGAFRSRTRRVGRWAEEPTDYAVFLMYAGDDGRPVSHPEALEIWRLGIGRKRKGFWLFEAGGRWYVRYSLRGDASHLPVKEQSVRGKLEVAALGAIPEGMSPPSRHVPAWARPLPFERPPEELPLSGATERIPSLGSLEPWKMDPPHDDGWHWRTLKRKRGKEVRTRP